MPRALRQIAAERRWWRENRHKAPQAFDEDLDAIIELIALSPGAGLLVTVRKGLARRAELRRTGHYIYYRLTDDDSIEIIALWHSARRPPSL
jgi:plasmid stabilization system protein ParE